MKRIIIVTAVLIIFVPTIVTADHLLIIRDIRATSTLVEGSDPSHYGPMKVLDGDSLTCWVEGVPGPGIGETLIIYLDKPYIIFGVDIEPGFFNPQYWQANNRIKSLEVLYFRNGQQVMSSTHTFNDKMIPQTIRFHVDTLCDEFHFRIDSVTKGDKWDDTCISEIQLFGDFSEIIFRPDGPGDDWGLPPFSKLTLIVHGEDGKSDIYIREFRLHPDGTFTGDFEGFVSAYKLKGTWTYYVDTRVIDLIYDAQQTVVPMGTEPEAGSKSQLEIFYHPDGRYLFPIEGSHGETEYLECSAEFE